MSGVRFPHRLGDGVEQWFLSGVCEKQGYRNVSLHTREQSRKVKILNMLNTKLSLASDHVVKLSSIFVSSSSQRCCLETGHFKFLCL